MPRECPDPNVVCFATGHGYRFHSDSAQANVGPALPRLPGKPELAKAQYRAQKALLLRLLRGTDCEQVRLSRP